MLLVGVVEGVKVVVVDVVAVKDIGDEFKERGFPDTSLANEKDCVGRFRWARVELCVDDTLLERLYVAGKYGWKSCTKGVVETYLIVGV